LEGGEVQKVQKVQSKKNDVAEVAEMAEKWALKDNLCHLRHLCQCKFLYRRQ
jgi:hypothetical protein